MKTKLINPRFDKTLTALCAAVLRRQKIFRLYSPLKPWYDKTWRPSEIELVR